MAFSETRRTPAKLRPAKTVTERVKCAEMERKRRAAAFQLVVIVVRHRPGVFRHADYQPALRLRAAG